MISTGVPVTVGIFEWISQYASKNIQWFNKNHSDYQTISRHIRKESTWEESPPICDFYRWLALLALSFDGGLLSSNLKSISQSNGKITIGWTNRITHRITETGWDRQTRNALDYIFMRCCSVQDFQINPYGVLHPLNHYFLYYANELSEHIQFLSNIQHSDFIQNSSLMFLALSTLPVATLEPFYISMASHIPEDLFFDKLPVSAKMFFSNPTPDTVLVIDKVKMHYNLIHNANLPEGLHHTLLQLTKDILTQLQKTPHWQSVDSEISTICHSQFKPRLTLLNAVLDAFKWPK